jgi:hypothetical protein
VPSYRFGNHTAVNVTPRLNDLAGLSATDTLPIDRCVIFAEGQAGIQAAGAHGFVTTADPTQDDPLHFLITLTAGWLMTMAQWAAGRAGINQADPATWPVPSAALYAISARYQLTEEAAMVRAASGGLKVEKGPEIDRKRVQILWHVDYWDGPLSGIASYMGKDYWFQVIDPDAEPRAAILRSLTNAELAAEQQRHRLFVQNVGNHTDYDSAGKRSVGALHASGTWDRYYESAVTTDERRRYDENPVIGWFVL